MSVREEIKQQALGAIKSAIVYPDLGRLAASAIVSDLTGRGGIKHEWNQIEPHVQREIVDVWSEIINTIFDGDFDVKKHIKSANCK